MLGILDKVGVPDPEAFAARSEQLRLSTPDQFLPHLTLGRLANNQPVSLPVVNQAAGLRLKLGELWVQGANRSGRDNSDQ